MGAGVQGILQQAGARHRTHATGYGGNPASAFRRRSELHITHQATVFHSVDTHINHDGTGLDPFAFHQAGFAGRYHHQI